ncbi:V-type ATP synthase subunit D [Ruegeria sp. 2205SS24-7]|uniref:V-type ATP synthase subunit D n=1 Tax=Ruegeria discodermiae TaxID=3064389 RepID=UPI0027426043|nr:V-type ATP synthase subunit D [Ruegeria sp. 2205SS24-7]MDP5217159.1 V-type ATP synthase subunit D [Ruegeria sp. 2205SS24-7]
MQLNKSSLAHQTAQLKTFEKFLPSLDLKRQQLMGERAKAVAQVGEMERKVEELAQQVGRDVPMLGNSDIDLKGLVRLTRYELGEENVVGTKLPVLDRIEVEIRPYSPMVLPHWVDNVTKLLHDMLEARLRVKVARQRVEILSKAVDLITQRVNLFDKVLIPNARDNIKKISIYLNDEEMASVVRSKIAKRKRAMA